MWTVYGSGWDPLYMVITSELYPLSFSALCQNLKCAYTITERKANLI
jgi:hypothetical protein